MHTSRLAAPGLAASFAIAVLTACTTTAPPSESGAVATAPTPVAAKPVFGTFGFDATGMDASVRPGDDFFRHSGGTWLKTNTMPQDRSRWGSFDQLAARAEADTRAILDELAAQTTHPAGSIEQKVADYYRSFLDTGRIDAQGLAPLQPSVEAIRGAKSPADMAALIARPELLADGPIGIGISLDQKDPDRYVILVTQAGLGLPEREYYLREDEQFATLRRQYVEHLARLLALAQWPDPQGAAQRVLDFETAVARLHWPIAKRRDREATYNLTSWQQLLALAPQYAWAEAFAAADLPTGAPIIVRELDAIGPLASLYMTTPTGTLRDYTVARLLRNVAAVLPRAFDEEVFAFYGRTLSGQPQQRDRWKRSVEAVNGSLGEAVGQLYVARHFSPAAKAAMQTLVENMRRAFAQRIDSNPWMSAATKPAARLKLQTFRAKIGYPDRWRDFAALEVRAGDAFGNRVRANVFEWRHDRARLDRKTDRDEWFLPPQTVNAYYNPVFNEIVFPAAILQPPFFDVAADAAVNYGGIGGVIGHEMGHGFDDQGAKSDHLGVLRNWWQEGDVAAFKGLGDRLAAQYSNYEPLPGLRINGRLTLGENIGDLGGLTVAHTAYRLSLDGKPARLIDGMTGDQRLFHGWAQVWRSLYRDESLRNQLLTAPHSPGEYRVNAVLRNMDAWYEAFGVQAGDKLWLPPEDRVRIW